eukprot:11535319-Alexandrium_andersonii.AAC.1
MALGIMHSRLPPLPGRSPRARTAPGSLFRPGAGPRLRAVHQARLPTRCQTLGPRGIGGVGLSRVLGSRGSLSIQSNVACGRTPTKPWTWKLSPRAIGSG